MKLNDKEWLERVQIAYKVYSNEVRPSLDIETFISWLYKQYGIVETNHTGYKNENRI